MPKLLILIGLLSFRAFAGDTTYSRTEPVPKRECGREATDESDGHSLLGDILGAILSGDRGDYSPSPARVPVAKPADMRDWPEGAWRWGLGFGAGAIGLPDQAGGAQVKADGEATYAFTRDFQVRLQGGGFAGLLDPLVDYRRDVYVDGRFIGRQYDTTLLFVQSGYSFFSDLLAILDRKGAYVGAGAGLIRLRESVDYGRREDFRPAAAGERTEARWHWLPAVRAAFGFYAGGHRGHPFGRIEFAYQAALNSPLYASSFPTDNTGTTHSLCLGFAWM